MNWTGAATSTRSALTRRSSVARRSSESIAQRPVCAHLSQARQGPIVDPRIEAITLADPKILGAVVSWAIYTFALYARKRGVGGKRSAYISVIGFAIVLFNFVPIGYFLTRSHNFGG